ncbi:tetratricopeptide repeat protein [Chitinibacter sp. ZOR0017]|uniref:tetratricopeptide repeat protein n=1 Tax=Chitinibacter sp. ZOR0017 TaxID=1339254 RepID=UPI000691D3F4|nr:tetratricopeptide repeat protein [Chitinibacter sp. ZOR0017]
MVKRANFVMLQKKKIIVGMLVGAVLAGAAYGWTEHQRQLALATPAEQVTALMVNMSADQASAVQLRRLVEHGHPLALRLLARDYHLRGDKASQVQALAWYQQAAAAGDHTASYELAAMLVQGQQSAADPVQARHWLAKAADLPAAQFLLGQLMRQGLGGAKDEAAGRALIEKAAHAGDRQALYTLANWYRYADGKPRDEAQAVRLYQQAANRQYPPALQDLALAYEFGELGLEVNPERASQLRNMALHIASCKDSHTALVRFF